MLRLAWSLGRRAWPEIRLLPLRAAVALGASGLGQPPRPRQLLKAYGIVLPIGLATWWAIPQLTWVMSPSIDAWAIRSAPGVIHRGDLVSFMLSHPLAGPKPVAVTKYALCLPADRLDFVEKPSFVPGKLDGYYYCNGRLLAVSKPIGRDGRPLAHFRPRARRIPAGMVFVGSRHPSSFDSRYYGPVSIGRLIRMERVL
ncbi:S26 family signal peptidase [Sphingomonas sp. BIUV-7]|uniref:S26 family signal peptidase n=1 Tax=Sphingomonas natans TaxID=3063330 RepID=A0ABT8YAT6_9SPHN|nr:S26 family signal peptidase [Sphingomonas sp. BIUV-7]MDO6415447.1 S26 family signal peptidase [Sphingomonas sp. BIUV-7]